MDYQRIFKDGIHLLAGKVGTIILTMLDLMILARILTTEEMGKYSLFFMVVNLGITIGLSWSDSSIVRHGREEYVRHKKVNESFWARSFLFFPIMFFCVALFLIFARPIANYIGIGSGVIVFVVTLFILNGLVNFMIKVFQSVDLMKKSAYVLLYQKIFYFIGLSLMLLGVFEGKLSMVLLFVNLAFLLTFIVNLIQLDFALITPYKFSKVYFRRIWKYSWPQLIGFSGLYIVNYIDIFVIRKYMTLSDVGVYNVAYSGFANIMGVIMLVNTVFMPLIVEYRAKRQHDMIKKYLDKLPLYTLAWTAFVIVGVFASSTVIPLLFSDKYTASVAPFNVLLVASIFYFISIYFLPIINSFDLIIFSQVFNVIKSAANVIFDFMLVPKIGIMGAAWGTLISYAVASFCSLLLVCYYRHRILGTQ